MPIFKSHYTFQFYHIVTLITYLVFGDMIILYSEEETAASQLAYSLGPLSTRVSSGGGGGGSQNLDFFFALFIILYRVERGPY